jgi:hypothetical protein
VLIPFFFLVDIYSISIDNYFPTLALALYGGFAFKQILFLFAGVASLQFVATQSLDSLANAFGGEDICVSY